MKISNVEFENVLIANMKIFVYLANKYICSFSEYEVIDLIHEQKLACYRARDKYSGSSKIGTFLFAVSENHLRNIYRRNNRKKRKPKQLVYRDIEIVETLALNESMENVEYQAIVAEQIGYLQRLAKKCLSTFEYNVYVSTFINNREIIETAELIGVDKRSVENAVTRIRRKLQEKSKIYPNL